MKLFKRPTLSALSISTLFSLSLEAKTLIIDDFLKYQDTSNIKFDFEQPVEGLTPYESQFYFPKIGSECIHNVSILSDDEAYEYVKQCKGEANLNAFEARRHKSQFFESYVNEFREYQNKFVQWFKDIDRIEIRNIIIPFKLSNYDLDSEMYTTTLRNSPDESAFYLDFAKNIRAGSNEGNENLVLRNVDSIFYIHRVSFKIPAEIAERVYTDGGAMIFTLKSDLKLNGNKAEIFNNAYLDITNTNAVEDIKSVFDVDIVEKNNLYTSALFNHSSWSKLRDLFIKGDNKTDIANVINTLNDKRIIYSVKDLEDLGNE